MVQNDEALLNSDHANDKVTWHLCFEILVFLNRVSVCLDFKETDFHRNFWFESECGST
jgi:hypothetical protein